MAKWLCTSSHIFYTDLGRAYNVYAPSTGTTMNTALLSVIYGNLIQGNSSLKAQVRFLQSLCLLSSPIYVSSLFFHVYSCFYI